MIGTVQERDMDRIADILRDGTLLIATFGYAGIFIALLVEGSGIPLPFPGTFLLAFVGYTVWSGNLHIAGAITAAAAGLTTGGWLLYRAARDAGPQLLARYGRRLSLSQQKLVSAESWFRDHAGRATFFARLTPGVRVYISIAAGLAHMQQGLFIVATFAGTALWSFAFIALGWTLGESWQNVTGLLNIIQSWLLVALIVIAVVLVARFNSERNPKS
jgi:membrane protein DedA with SNARE-associated domain